MDNVEAIETYIRSLSVVDGKDGALLDISTPAKRNAVMRKIDGDMATSKLGPNILTALKAHLLEGDVEPLGFEKSDDTAIPKTFTTKAGQAALQTGEKVSSAEKIVIKALENLGKKEFHIVIDTGYDDDIQETRIWPENSVFTPRYNPTGASGAMNAATETHAQIYTPSANPSATNQLIDTIKGLDFADGVHGGKISGDNVNVQNALQSEIASAHKNGYTELETLLKGLSSELNKKPSNPYSKLDQHIQSALGEANITIRYQGDAAETPLQPLGKKPQGPYLGPGQ